ncbi:Allatotropin [Frankliniella occidentalis]|uniref:Allatotropins-like n=1 Tax=Frankliniella occidentalis TaxID=133901 RepID=A0A6J1SIU0_FRAOC|nr:allatotropins-like [Frankliniella occidentalis]KAE8742325.1 Allatotropin [Frankliniella occidentalis]
MRCQATAPLALLCAAVLVLIVASASAAPGPGRQVQTKPRTIRGFKNVVLSTARNFGKRGGAPMDGAQGEFVDEATMQANGAEYQRAPGNSFPVQWFVEEIQSNPELARSVVRKFIDENQDGELSAEELLRPVY